MTFYSFFVNFFSVWILFTSHACLYLLSIQFHSCLLLPTSHLFYFSSIFINNPPKPTCTALGYRAIYWSMLIGQEPIWGHSKASGVNLLLLCIKWTDIVSNRYLRLQLHLQLYPWTVSSASGSHQGSLFVQYMLFKIIPNSFLVQRFFSHKQQQSDKTIKLIKLLHAQDHLRFVGEPGDHPMPLKQ